MAAKNKNKRNLKNRKINSNIIRLLEIHDLYHVLPFKVKELIIDYNWPKISLDINEVKDFPNINEISERIKNSFSNASIKINNKDLNLLDSSNVIALDSMIAALYSSSVNRSPNMLKKNKDIALVRSIKSFYEKISEKMYETSRDVWSKSAEMMADIAWEAIREYYRFDKNGLYFHFSDNKGLNVKKNHVISLKSFPSIKRTFNVDKKPRDSYLCYSFDKDGVSESSIPQGVVGNFQPLKVYVQDHAINRIMERLKLNSYGDLFLSLSYSLKNLIVSDKHSDCYFVDYYYAKHKLGYLLVSLEEDAALIRTFKFITMHGTPEYFKLKKHLGGVREDFEYLGMDSLDLINSDALLDPKLREIFKKCDLGHLFDVKKQVTFEAPQSLIASDIKKYFRIEVKNEN